VQYPR